MKQHIIDQKMKVRTRARFTCEYHNELGIRCTSRDSETAHRIGQGKYARRAIFNKIKEWRGIELSKKDIDNIVWHEDNFVACCSNKAHNDAFNIHISQTKKFDELLNKIFKNISR